MRLRFDPRHHVFTNELWAMLTPDLAVCRHGTDVAPANIF